MPNFGQLQSVCALCRSSKRIITSLAVSEFPVSTGFINTSYNLVFLLRHLPIYRHDLMSNILVPRYGYTEGFGAYPVRSHHNWLH